MPSKNTSKISSKGHQFGKIKSKRWGLVEEYCENSTVHGTRYFSNRKLSLFERLYF